MVGDAQIGALVVRRQRLDDALSSGAGEDGEQSEDGLVGGDGERRDGESIARLEVEVEVRRVAGGGGRIAEESLGSERVGEGGPFCEESGLADVKGKGEQQLTSCF